MFLGGSEFWVIRIRISGVQVFRFWGLEVLVFGLSLSIVLSWVSGEMYETT